MSSIGIIGNGIVGKATNLLFKSNKNRIFDLDRKKRVNCKDFDNLLDCELIFVCVPTPLDDSKKLDVSGVDDSVKRLLSSGIDPWRIVIRSTVPVGTTADLGVSFMPEFLRDDTWEKDIEFTSRLLIGVPDGPEWNDNIKSLSSTVDKLLVEAKMIIMHKSTALECIKLSRNAFLATKVSFFNEIKEFCDNNDIDYDEVWRGVGVDSRIGTSHIQVPGPDGKAGWGGKCLPKDVNGLVAQMRASGVKSHVITGALERNESIDRPNK